MVAALAQIIGNVIMIDIYYYKVVKIDIKKIFDEIFVIIPVMISFGLGNLIKYFGRLIILWILL